MSLIISGATVIDGIASKPMEGQAIWVENGRIRAIIPSGDIRPPVGTKQIDVSGKYAIPGLMNANVHLFCEIRLENLARYMGRYDELIAEAAQVALKNGLTTVFDTWGPRRFLMQVRDQINAGQVLGSRIFCAGNIVGLDGPFSQDFDLFAKHSGAASAAFAKRINAIWVENTGRHLCWLPPEEVAREVRTYIGRGIDFVKYASNDHWPGVFLAFSPRTQMAIVEEAHRAGITAQAHTMSVEGLHVAVDAGCDLIQHANLTGPVPIPEATLELMVKRKTGAVIFPFKERLREWARKNDVQSITFETEDVNTRNFIRWGASLMLANDGLILASEMLEDPVFGKSVVAQPDSLWRLDTGHFAWFEAMEEKGCPAMQMLKAATRNIAVAYGKDSDLGTLEPGKIADILILDENPLAAAKNYRGIHMIIKDGEVVDRDALPVRPILTKAPEPPYEEEKSYVPFVTSGKTLPLCVMCLLHDT